MAVMRKKYRKNGDFIYEIDYRFKGARFRISTKTNDRKTAQKILDDIRAKISSGRFKVDEFKEVNISLKDLGSQYIQQYGKVYKAPGTINIDRQALDDLCRFMGANKTARSVTVQDVYGFQSWLLDKKLAWAAQKDKNGDIVEPEIYGLNPSTVNIKIRALRAIFNWARSEDRNYVDKNPFSTVKQIRIETKVPFAMSPAEIQAILRQADQDKYGGKKFKPFMKFLLMTACRRTEAVDLTWGQVDFINRAVTFKRTKGKRERAIPINDELMRLLQEILAEAEQTGPSDRVFKYSKDKPSKKFRDYVKSAGLRPELHLHCIRHTAAKNMMDQKVHLMLIKDTLGHADVKTTEIYLRSFPEHLRPAFDALSVSKYMTEDQESSAA